MKKTYTLPYSEYYSTVFADLWNEMLLRYDFHDGKLERTVQNYGSTVKLICDYCGKDFFALTEKDVQAFFSYLDERVEIQTLSATTAYTYKKNLHSVGNHFARMLGERGGEYHSPFCNQFHSDKAARGETKTTDRDDFSSQIQKEELQENCRKLLESVKAREAEQYYYIFSMLAYFIAVTPVKICEMKPDQIEIKDDKAFFRFEISKRMPKTRVEGRLNYDTQKIMQVTYRFPQSLEKDFIHFYPTYLNRIEGKLASPREAVFYNRNYKPVNFKTLGTIFRKNIALINDPTIRSIHDLCGVLYEDAYCTEIK